MPLPINACKINEEMKRERPGYSSLLSGHQRFCEWFYGRVPAYFTTWPLILKHVELQPLSLSLFLSRYSRHENISEKRRKLRSSIDFFFWHGPIKATRRLKYTFDDANWNLWGFVSIPSTAALQVQLGWEVIQIRLSNAHKDLDIVQQVQDALSRAIFFVCLFFSIYEEESENVSKREFFISAYHFFYINLIIRLD